jgi:uncharacterized protein YbjT (DUF2867 family)
MKTQILITGATGTTGQYAVESLINKGVNVRAMVRTIDKRSKKLEEIGAEVVQGNFLDLDSLRIALKGIKKVYLCYPFQDKLPKGAGYFAKAAKENGVELTVAMSQMNAHEGSLSPATQNHLITEDILDWANIGAVHIRPGLFASNYRNIAGPTVQSEGKFYFPNSEAKYTIIHPEDISDVVVGILTSNEPKKHIGKKYVLAGSKVYTGKEVAEEIGKLVDKHVEYVPIPVDHWIDYMKNDPYVNDFLVKHLKEFSKDIANGKFNVTNNVVKDITGHQPRSFTQYIEEHSYAFNS